MIMKCFVYLVLIPMLCIVSLAMLIMMAALTYQIFTHLKYLFT